MDLTVGAERRIFNEDVPKEFIFETIDILLASYIEAHTTCKLRYAATEARYALPHIQRANFEGDWRKVKRKFPAGKARIRKNTRGDGHTRYVFGRVVMTASAVSEPDELPRRAVFRNTYAGEQQTDLFDKDATVPRGTALYAMLTHGPRRAGSPVPAFIRILFPSKDCKSLVDYIDLTPCLQERIEPPVDDTAVEHPEEATDDLVLQLREHLKRKKA
jgi:hypothetical protein